ncbi:hypothetical protein LI328DRAFT_64565 [Trichoderma asperelloides]|nr:hypothetical protein LI328DRAFT_64565 [Trichoderma asperelloides]
MMKETSQCMMVSRATDPSVFFVRVFLFFLSFSCLPRQACLLAGFGWFSGPHLLSLFFFSYVWLGAGRDIENYRETMACIFVSEIGRHIVGLCTSILQELLRMPN